MYIPTHPLPHLKSIGYLYIYTAVPRGLFSWSKAGLFWALDRANTPESRSTVQLAPLQMWIAERSWCGHAAAASSSKLYSCLSPPPFPSDILPQSWTADYSKTLILKFTWTPNMFGTIVLVFIQQRIHLVQTNNLCMVHTKKYEVHNDIEVHRLFSRKQQHNNNNNI